MPLENKRILVRYLLINYRIYSIEPVIVKPTSKTILILQSSLYFIGTYNKMYFIQFLSLKLEKKIF